VTQIFDRYAKFYDSLYAEKDYAEECAYVLSLVEDLGIQSALDFGCGTGKFTEQFAAKGFRVDGVDLSAEMIQIAQERLRGIPAITSEKISYSVADVRAFSSEKQYDLVYSLFHVINYMTSDDDLRKFFSSSASALRKDGLLIFDFWYGPGVEADSPMERKKVVEWNGETVIRTAKPKLIPEKNLVMVEYQMEIAEEKFSELHNMRYLFDADIDSFSAPYFTTESILGWREDTAPTSDNWNAVAILKRI
jgi:SAM-dependent methyltransferase